MNKIYIITREGRAYSSEGLQLAEKTIREDFPEDHKSDEQTVFMQGSDYNDMKYLVACLETDKNTDNTAFILGSFDGATRVWVVEEAFYNTLLKIAFPPTNIGSLNDIVGNTTWEFLSFLRERRGE